MAIKWENISGVGPGPGKTFRAEVPGGWLVAVRKETVGLPGTGLVFVPDPEHTWES